MSVAQQAVEEQLEAKEVQLSQPSSTSLLSDLFWANLRVQLHLPPLDLAWNPVVMCVCVCVCDSGGDGEVMLNVLRCQLTY